MANSDINVSQELLNRLDNEIVDLTRAILDAQGIVLTLKFISKRLRENYEPFTKH